jgi:hypothetical protein
MELRSSSIVASLRRRNNVVLVHCYVTGHRRDVATETITRNTIMPDIHIGKTSTLKATSTKIGVF